MHAKPNRLRRSLLPGVLEVNTLSTGSGAEEGGLGLFKGEAGHGEHERQLRKLGDGTGGSCWRTMTIEVTR